MNEYASDEFASGSEERETLKESQGGSKQEKETAYVRSPRARQKIQRSFDFAGSAAFLLCANLTLYLLRSPFCLIISGLLCLFSRLLGSARDPPMSELAWFLAVI